MSYIRFGWGLHHIKGKSDSYIICHVAEGNRREFIDCYGLGDLGMAELLCDAIDEHWKDDKLFALWFKKEVAKRLGVELRDKKISFEQSLAMLEGKLDPVTLHRFSKKEMAERKAQEEKDEAATDAELDRLMTCTICKRMIDLHAKDGRCLGKTTKFTAPKK